MASLKKYWLLLLILLPLGLSAQTPTVSVPGHNVYFLLDTLDQPTEMALPRDRFELYFSLLWKFTGHLYSIPDSGTPYAYRISSDFTPPTCGCNYPYGYTDIQFANEKVYVINNFGRLTEIDLATGTSQVLNNFNQFSIEAGLDIKNDSLIYFTSGTGLAREIWEYNINSGVSTLKISNLPQQSTSLEYDPVYDRFYFLNLVDGAIYVANPDSGIYSRLGTFSGMGNIAVDPNGRYVYGRVDVGIAQIDAFTGAVSIFSLNMAFGRFMDMEFGLSRNPMNAASDKSLYFISDSLIWEINGFHGCLGPDTSFTATGFAMDESCPGNQDGMVNLNVSGGKAPYTYEWSNGDSVSNLTGVPAGTYEVTIRDTNLCPLFMDFEINTQPAVNLDLGPDSLICQGDSVVFAANQPFVSYAWNGGDTNATILANKQGEYTLTVLDTNGCAGTDSVYLTVANLPQANLGPDTLLCFGTEYFLDAGIGYNQYNWSTGSTASSETVLNPGSYSVAITDSNGCIGEDTVLVTYQNQLADPNLQTSGPDTICQLDTLVAMADTGFNAYLWFNGDTTNWTEIHSGGYHTVTVWNGNGCSRLDSVWVTYMDFPDPKPYVLPGGNVEICPGASVTLDPGPGYFTYLWNNGNISQTITVSQPGAYEVEVSNGFGCKETSNQVVVSHLTPDQPEIYSGAVNELLASLGTSYQWSLNGVNIFGASNQNLIISQTGLYGVAVTDTNGCQGAADTLVSLVGIDGNRIGKPIRLYPNPTHSRVNADLPADFAEGGELRLLDQMGRVLQETTLQPGTTQAQLSLGSYAAGIYFVELKSQGKVWLGKVVRE